jgi:3-isopropylmalate/(R)-2-methylmalate dehydratase small subunit
VPAEPQTLEAAALVVAGKHFGQSSGRAIAVKALRATGVGCVVGETFARTFYCNAFEVGLPVLEFRGVTELVSDGDVLTVDVSAGEAFEELAEQRLDHRANVLTVVAG